MGPGLWWVSLPPAASINQHYCSWLWVWPQQSTAVAFILFPPSVGIKQVKISGTPTQPPPRHFYFQSTEAPSVLRPTMQSPEHPSEKQHVAAAAKCRILDKKRYYWYRWFYGAFIFHREKEKKGMQYFKIQSDAGIFVGGRKWRKVRLIPQLNAVASRRKQNLCTKMTSVVNPGVAGCHRLHNPVKQHPPPDR